MTVLLWLLWLVDVGDNIEYWMKRHKRERRREKEEPWFFGGDMSDLASGIHCSVCITLK